MHVKWVEQLVQHLERQVRRLLREPDLVQEHEGLDEIRLDIGNRPGRFASL